MYLRKTAPYMILLSLMTYTSLAQEVVTGLSVNMQVRHEVLSKLYTKSASQDTLELPFFDDFSGGAPLPSTTKWADDFVFINNTYPVNQPTQGVATFDALSNTGLLYENAGSAQFEADRLTSAPINLAGTAADNFYLSFFYQPQGIADPPEPADSLTLQFYSPVTGKWHSVWRAEGGEVDDFKPVIIRVDDARYLARGFRFRFINYASLSSTISDPAMAGNADHWHIDYVYLDGNRNGNDTLIADVAFTLPLRAPLTNYESMPWNQFREGYISEQGTAVTLNYRNNDNIVRNVTRSFIIRDLYDDVDAYSSIQGATNVSPGQNVIFDAPLFYIFNTTNPDSALFLIKGILKTDDFDPKINDTITYLQKFSNYFSVDDGTAESGYGINGQGANNAMAVYRYRSYMKDSVRAVSICFNDSYLSSNKRSFDIVVLEDNNGIPGDIIYAEEEFMVDPGNDLNGFATYWLSDPVEVDGYFFVGWRQRSETFLNAGLDMNTPHLNRQFYYINGSWGVSMVKGSLMIRPVTGKQVISAIPGHESYGNIRIWPNPAKEIINIGYPGENIYSGYEIKIFDGTGRQWIRCNATEQVDISMLPQGIYFLQVYRDGRGEGLSKFLRIR